MLNILNLNMKEKKEGIKLALLDTLRIKVKDLNVYKKTHKGWEKSDKLFPEAIEAIKLFKSNNNFKFLIDKINPEFIKGQFYKGKCQGARINILPDGKKLDKAYSLFAKNLTIHNENSNSHWDVIYQNPDRKYAYVYTLRKHNNAVKKKYNEVKDFKKYYHQIIKRAYSALKNENDYLALPMYTLLETYMRVGNEIYYKAHGHKGLSTLKKSNIKIKGNNVTFNYLAKDGVPIKITKQFPEIYIKRLKKIINSTKNSDFIFTNSHGHPLQDIEFKEAFKHYCGKEFYPHIVRSFYATNKAEEFLKSHKSATKEEIKDLFNSIAEKLGHKKFDKKSKEWKDNYNVTIHHYIQPQVLDKIKAAIK